MDTLYAWKAKFGDMSVTEAQPLRSLEEENRRLKTLVADQALNIPMLQSVVEEILALAKSVPRLLISGKILSPASDERAVCSRSLAAPTDKAHAAST